MYTMPKHGIYYFIYYFVYSNIGHILLHEYVVNQDSWLMPLVIFVVKVIYVINHVTFITKLGKTMISITTIKK
jgi:hypothetical protein